MQLRYFLPVLIFILMLWMSSACHQKSSGWIFLGARFFDGDTLRISRETKTGNLTLNEYAKTFSKNWKNEAKSGTDPFRKKSAEFLDADSSILIGLTEKEVISFLGPFENVQKNGYRFDKHFTDKNEDFSCWLQLFFDEKRTVIDVARMCP